MVKANDASTERDAPVAAAEPGSYRRNGDYLPLLLVPGLAAGALA